MLRHEQARYQDGEEARGEEGTHRGRGACGGEPGVEAEVVGECEPVKIEKYNWLL